MFAIYLAPAVSGFYEWFGSIAPDALKHENGQLVVKHADVARLVEQAERAIDEVGRSSNINTWLAIECMTAAFHAAAHD